MKTALATTKFLLILSLFLIGSPGIQAQVRLAAEAGIHSATIIENNSIPGWDTAVKKYFSPRTGFKLGVLLEIPLGKSFFFQPGINYASKGHEYSRYNDSATMYSTDTVYSQYTIKLGYVEIPLYLTYKIPLSANGLNHFFLSAGPYLAFFYNGTENLQSRTYSTNEYNNQNNDLLVGNAPDKYKTFDFGINAKAGFELGNVMLSAYFSRGLGNFYTADYPSSFHHQLVGGSLGIWLTKAVPPQPKPLPVLVAVNKDSDGDGVPDAQDSCPTVPGSKVWHGCPVPDTDHDGIDDEHDSCKTIPGVARYNGCPVPDTDGDGIDDEHDSCKTVPGLARYNGCPIPDRDGDGVNDEEDQCPDQPGTKENHGCPLAPKVPATIRFEKAVQFQSSSSRLTSISLVALNDLADTLNIHPDLHLTIEGHADASGNAAENIKLSKDRAEAVKAYLVKRGINPARISTVGYGQQHPLADNTSAAGKAINRRVEFRLDNQP
ncbi:MAG TPA: OmpA family protein [Puia sp.]|nr:OmpA family protein [Puia sp.]